MNNTTPLSRVDGATTLYDNTYLSSLLTRLQAQNHKSRLGSDSVAYVQAYPCLLLIDTANAVLLKLYQTYTPSYSATDPFNLVWQLNFIKLLDRSSHDCFWNASHRVSCQSCRSPYGSVHRECHQLYRWIPDGRFQRHVREVSGDAQVNCHVWRLVDGGRKRSAHYEYRLLRYKGS